MAALSRTGSPPSGPGGAEPLPAARFAASPPAAPTASEAGRSAHIPRALPPLLALCLLLALSVSITGCAKEGFPPGGPEDTEAPEVVGMFPEPGSVEVDRGQPIVFRFSEAMNKRSVENALFFTPDIGPTLWPSWHGEELRLRPRVPLRENTTIVVTLGADAADMRRNRLGRSVTLAFSTGPTLDQGAISGRVFQQGEPVGGAWVWLYPSEGEREAVVGAPDPARAASEEDPVYPLYVKQADDDGSFSFTNLARDTYRLFAFRDADGRLPYDPDTDLLAVPTTDLEIARARDRWQRVQVGVAPRDTIGPLIRSVRAPDLRHLRVRFSEPPASRPMPRILLEPAEQAPAPEVLRGYFPLQAPGSMVLLVSGLVEEASYRARLLYAADGLGNPHREASRPVTFTAPAREDTTRPRVVSFTPPDSSRSLNTRSVMQLTFSTEIDTAALQPWSLQGPGEVVLERTWLDPLNVELRPRGAVEVDAWYALEIPAEGLVSWTGQTGPEEPVRITWRGAPLPGTGWLMITVEGEPLDGEGSYRLVLEGVETGTPPRTLLVREGPGRFESPELPVGPYMLWGWYDVDGDGEWDAGSVDPFRPSEVMSAVADSLYVNDSFYSEVDTPLYLGLPLRSLAPPDTAAGAVGDTGTVVPPPHPLPGMDP